jgi:hypothetical protein
METEAQFSLCCLERSV